MKVGTDCDGLIVVVVLLLPVLLLLLALPPVLPHLPNDVGNRDGNVVRKRRVEARLRQLVGQGTQGVVLEENGRGRLV